MGDSVNVTYGGFKIQYVQNGDKFGFVIEKKVVDWAGTSSYKVESTLRYDSKMDALAEGLIEAKHTLEELKSRGLVR